MGKEISKSLSKNLSNKYSQKPFDHAQQSTTDAIKTTSKRMTKKNSRCNW